MTTATATETTKTPLPEHIKGSYGTMYYVKDMKATVDFYKNKIGLTPTFEDEGWTEFDIGGHRLCLHKNDGSVQVSPGTALIIESTDIRALVARLRAKNVEIVKDVQDVGGDMGWCADAKDPEGNIIGFYQHNTK